MEIVKLNTICDLKNGFAFKSKDYVDESNTLSCRMSSIRPGGNFDLEHNKRYLPDNYAELYSDYLLVDGDIVIAMTDLAGDPKILGVPTIVRTNGKKLLQNQRVGKLIVKDKSKVHIPFLQYALNRPVNKTYYKKFAGGGLQINVGKKEILGNTVPLPPLDQQKKIAAILDAADTYRQKTKALLKKYDALTQSLFLDMFGDPVTNPKGWRFEKLSNLIIQKPDNGFFAKKDKYGDNGTPVVWLTDFIDKVYISENNLRRAITDDKDDKYLLEYGDALFCRSSLNVEGIGKCSIAPSTFKEPTIFECHIIRLKLDMSRIVPEYLRFLTETAYFRGNVMKNAKTSTMTTIAQEGISKIEVPVPDYAVQLNFKKHLVAIEAQKTLAQQELEKADNLFNSLLQKAFKGKLTK